MDGEARVFSPKCLLLYKNGIKDSCCTEDIFIHTWEIVFEVLVPFPFQKYFTSWVFSGFSCSRAISGWDGMDGMDGMGWLSLGGAIYSIPVTRVSNGSGGWADLINQGQEAVPPLPPLYCFCVPWFK